MAEVTAALVKELRDKTGAGMMDCKRALGDSGGDIEAAVDWLRKKGLAAAANKAGRVAAEGLIGVATHGPVGVVVEVNSETDFVARNQEFQSLVKDVSELALDGDGEIESLKEAILPNSGRSVEAELTHLISTIGENLVDGRLRKFYEEVVLLEQIFVVDQQTRISTVVEEVAKAAGTPIRVTGFARFALGEGIDRHRTDFAAEVAAQLKN